MQNISKKIGYTSCREISVDKIPDELIKKYIKKYKSQDGLVKLQFIF